MATTESPPAPAPAAADTPAATLRLVRSDDQLDVLIRLFDVTVVDNRVTITGGNPRLQATFASQHLAEQTFATDDTVPTGGADVDAIAAGPTTLVAWITADFDLTVANVVAIVAGGLDAQSAFEVPRGLRLVPAVPTRLRTGGRPHTLGSTTELWVGRLEPVGPGPLELSVAANVATEEVVDGRPEAADRDALVANSSIAPLSSKRLWVSSAGAFADLHGEWDADLARYDHHITTGRDVHVEVQTLGYLLPFGHRAAITEVAHRVFVDDANGEPTALVRRSRHLAIVEPTVQLSGSFARHEGRGLPFTSVEASASATTEIEAAPVIDADGQEIEGADDIVTFGSGTDVMVTYSAIDRGGDPVTFELPATFIDDATAHGTGAGGAPARLVAVANDPTRLARRVVDLAGQPVAYADPEGAGTSSKPTHELTLKWQEPTTGASSTDLEGALTPAVFAAVEKAEVVDDVIGAVTGDIGARIGVTMHPRWLDFGNGDDNFDLAYLTLDQRTESSIGGDSHVRGVARLDIVGEVFNQKTGIGANRTAPDDGFEIGSVLGDASKIVGNISLQEIILAVLEPVLGIDLPGTTVTIDEDAGTAVATFTYCPKLESLPAVGFVANDDTRCCVTLTTTASLTDEIEASFSTEMLVQNFAFHFPPVIEPALVVVTFNSVSAKVNSDGSTSVDPDIASWDFSGALSLLMALVDKLGFGNVDFKVLSGMLDMDSSINLPDISLGVAELKNFSIQLGLEIPLDAGIGQLSFGIASKSAPLDIDIMMFGATFWLDFDLGFGGPADSPPVPVISIGVSVYWEMLDFDIIIASATFTLRLSASWKVSGDNVVVTGAVSLEGEIDILGGLLGASVSLVASLTYKSETETLTLKGTIHYSVDSFLGDITSGSVPIGSTTIELGDGAGSAAVSGVRRGVARALAAAPGGAASFGDRYTDVEWNDYCDAFA